MDNDKLFRPPKRYIDCSQQRQPVTNICELNEDCLNEIFRKLKLKDLIMLGSCNKQFHELVFHHIFSKTDCFVDDKVNYKRNHIPQQTYYLTHDKLKLYGFRIKSLILSKLNQEIIENLLKFCPNLERLKIVELHANSSKAPLFCQPLEKLKSLRFDNCRLGRTISQLQLWCETINRLELHNVTFYDLAFFNYQYLHLHHIILDCPKKCSHDALNAFIVSNPQLKTFKINSPFLDKQLFHFIWDNLEFLKSAEWKFVHGFLSIHYKANGIKTKSIVDEISIKSYDVHWSDILSLTSHQFPQIKLLTIKCDASKLNEDLKIHSKNLMFNLKSLSIDAKGLVLDKLVQISRLAPELSKIDVNCSIESSQILINCFETFSKLQELNVITATMSEQPFDQLYHQSFVVVTNERPKAKIFLKIKNSSVKYYIDKQSIRRYGKRTNLAKFNRYYDIGNVRFSLRDRIKRALLDQDSYLEQNPNDRNLYINWLRNQSNSSDEESF